MKSDIGKSTLNPIFRVSTVPQINFLFGIRKFTNLTMNPSLIFRIGLGRRKGWSLLGGQPFLASFFLNRVLATLRAAPFRKKS